MSRKKTPSKTLFDHARDELFSHIHRCGVLHGDAEQQVEWMKDTMEFMADRYPELSKAELTALHDVGLRFCQPVIPHGAPAPGEDTAAA